MDDNEQFDIDAIIEERKKWLEDLPNLIDRQIKEVELKIRELGSFNVIANSFLKNQIKSTKSYSDYEPDKLPIVTEYIALICLKFPFSSGNGEFTNAANLSKEHNEIHELASKIVMQSTLLLNKAESNLRINDPPELQKIANSLFKEEYFVRNAAIEEHHWDVLEGLFAQFDDVLFSKLGFDTYDGINLCITIHEFVTSQAKNAIAAIQTNWTEMYNEIVRFKNKRTKPQNFYPKDVLKELSNLSKSELRIHFQKFAHTYEQSVLGDRFSLTAEDLSKLSEIDISRVQSFLNTLSIQFGEVNPDFTLPEVIHPLKQNPIIVHKDRYTFASVALLDYSLDALFEKTLISNRKKFTDNKHDFLVNKAVELISGCLKTNLYYQNLYFNDGNQGELDGLIICENYAFFLEGKSHKITDKAKKGYLLNINDHIKEIIISSYQQAARAKKYTLKNDIAIFKDKKGKEIQINVSKVTDSFLISITYDQISKISNYLKASNNLFKDNEFPWIVCLYDLMIISDHLNSPTFFVNYLQKRKEFFKINKIDIDDEIDIMAYYLKHNLSFESVLDNNYDWVNVASLTDEINQYYLYKSGDSNIPQAIMSHFHSQETKEMIKTIESSSLEFKLNVSLFIVDLSPKTMMDLQKTIKMLRNRYKKDKQTRSFIFGGQYKNEKWGAAYFISSSSEMDIIQFKQYCKEQMIASNSKSWIGIFDSGVNNYNFIQFEFLKR